MTVAAVGLSGFAVYVPRYRVPLERWCAWNGQSWPKVSSVVGRSFRQIGRHESIYTMAANAVLRLIDRYDIDPQNVGFLGFGTESSTDNAAGAVIIRGMVDQALEATGRARLSRRLEVPELKHACLGGVYAMKSALRYLETDGRGRKAIVVCGDVAEYERGSSGEQTQGAGAVAMLLEESPRLCTVDLRNAGTSSAYRGVDFRKPVARHAMEHYTPDVKRLHDFPVFNGKYSTFCYLDAVTHAARDMFEKLAAAPADLYDSARAILTHRPYHHMPIQALATLTLWAMAETESRRPELRELCAKAGVEVEDLLAEMQVSRDLFEATQTAGVGTEPYPLATKVAKAWRGTPRFEALRTDKMTLGADAMMDLGNIYTAALPAWIAAAFEEALTKGEDLAGALLLTVGYGSGDAAEAIPMRVVAGWQDAARRIGFAKALTGAVDLEQAQYVALHDGLPLAELGYEPEGEFVVERVGQAVDAEFQDAGIEYYRYIAPKKAASRSAA